MTRSTTQAFLLPACSDMRLPEVDMTSSWAHYEDQVPLLCKWHSVAGEIIKISLLHQLPQKSIFQTRVKCYVHLILYPLSTSLQWWMQVLCKEIAPLRSIDLLIRPSVCSFALICWKSLEMWGIQYSKLLPLAWLTMLQEAQRLHLHVPHSTLMHIFLPKLCSILAQRIIELHRCVFPIYEN